MGAGRVMNGGENVIETAYSKEADMTFILKWTPLETGEMRVEVVGFYYGEPDETATCQYANAGGVAII